MSNLIPERRVDINGHVVTRHVRANKGAQGKSLYAPATPDFRSDAHLALAVALRNRLSEYPMMRGYSPIRDAKLKIDVSGIKGYVNSLSDDVAARCMDKMFDNETDEGYPLLLISAANSNEPNSMLSDIDFLYDPKDEYHSDPTWSKTANMADNHVYLRALVKGIRSYSKWGFALPDEFAKASPEDQKKVLALYQFADQELAYDHELAVKVEWSPEVFFLQISISDEEIFKQVSENPDKVTEIADFIHERGRSYHLLQEYMKEMSALRDGKL